MQEKSVKAISQLPDNVMQRLWFDAISGLAWIGGIQQGDISHL